MSSKFPKAFEDWYDRHIRVQCLQGFQHGEYKRALYNAWKSGRRYQKTRAYAYGDVVRWN